MSKFINFVTWLTLRRYSAQDRQRDGEGDEEEVEARKEELKEARKEWKRERQRWEREWWEQLLIHCELAAGWGDQEAVYKALNRLGK